MSLVHAACGSGRHTPARFILTLALSAAVAVPITTGSAHAAPVFFTSEAEFNDALTAAGISMAQDGFEGLPTGFIDSPLDRGGYAVSVANINPSVKLFVHHDPARATDGPTVLIAPPFVAPMTFDFDDTVRAFSVDLIDVRAFAPAFLTVGLDGAPLTSAYPLKQEASIDFFGVLDLGGFRSLALSTAFEQVPTLTSSTITIDRLRYEAAQVPEPSALLLLGAAALGLRARRAARVRRRPGR